MTWDEQLIARSSDRALAKNVAKAVHRLLHEDAFLLTGDANERSISHRLAIYLEQVLGDWDTIPYQTGVKWIS